MIVQMTKKERALHKCALMVLQDQCPPERKHYLCMKSEDDTAADCALCWRNYLWSIAEGTAELPEGVKA